LGPHFSFTCGVNGIDYTSMLAAVEISENRGFDGASRLIGKPAR
jgi:hypothetical protein